MFALSYSFFLLHSLPLICPSIIWWRIKCLLVGCANAPPPLPPPPLPPAHLHFTQFISTMLACPMAVTRRRRHHHQTSHLYVCIIYTENERAYLNFFSFNVRAFFFHLLFIRFVFFFCCSLYTEMENKQTRRMENVRRCSSQSPFAYHTDGSAKPKNRKDLHAGE